MRHILLSTVLFLFTIPAAAQNATLKINSDLIIHPAQIRSVFSITSDQINRSPEWNWPELDFQKPYKTHWSQVKAKGPFSFKVVSDKLSSQEASFEFTWNEPTVSVGQFSIQDTVVKDMGGVKVILNVTGGCNNMQWKVGSPWRVRGTVTWAIVNQQLQVQWRAFEFNGGNASTPVTADMGQCHGPQEVAQALRDSVQAAATDPNMMGELLRKGIMAWMNEALGNLRNELLTARTGNVNTGMTLTWDPQFMVNLPGGSIRIPGYVWVKKQGVGVLPAVIDRTLAEQDFSGVTESGFVLPKNALENIATFVYSTGDLRHRYKSTEIKGFTDLMNNWFNKWFVWPDLNKFATNTLFYFDLSSAGAPQLSNVRAGVDREGPLGVVYDAKTPVLINMHAPAGNIYLPYVDFRSTINGQFRATVRSQQLQMMLTTGSVPLTAAFRPEYKAFRGVNQKIDTNRLGKAGMDFVNGKVYTADLPKFNFGSNMQMVYGDLKLFKQSVMVPLSFQKK